MAIEYQDLPPYDHDSFQALINPQRDAHASSTPSLPTPPVDPSPPTDGRPERPTYASFGDQGTTATAGAYGTILRLSRYLPGEHTKSKLAGLEFSEGAGPFFVYYRTYLITDWLASPSKGFGLQVQSDELLRQARPPALRFIGDRWPDVTFDVQSFRVNVRLSCENHTIWQKFSVTNNSASPSSLDLVLEPRVNIYDLFYIFHSPAPDVTYHRGPYDHSLVILHKKQSPEENSSIPPDLRVLVELFRNGQSEKLEIPDTVDSNPELIDSIPVKCSLDANETVELAVAFRLEARTETVSYKDFLISTADLDPCLLNKCNYLPNDWPLKKDPVLNWHLRRNLEHILSVCSIPIDRATPSEDDGIDLPAVSPVALTSGDFGDHKVGVPGSFFAFKFLLEMYTRLGNLGQDPGAQVLRQRIRATCQGHVQWISGIDPETANASNFWVDGSAILGDVETAMPLEIPANMPMQILKAIGYLSVFNDRNNLLFVCSRLYPLINSWFLLLIRTKNKLSATWRHHELHHDAASQDIATFRLSDHIWIWKALHDVEELITRVENENQALSHPVLEKFATLKSYSPISNTRKATDRLRLDFTADELKKQIVRRFTIENDIVRQRMLSVKRSARETRFLFYSLDTALYYGVDWGFFQEDSTSDDLWRLLVRFQELHAEENDESVWDNPLRYGLATLMSAENDQLDKNIPATAMTPLARKILLHSSSDNGLFPGQLDETSKEPVLFTQESHRDFYFHVGFEIPYILLLSFSKIESSRQTRSDRGLGAQDARRKMARTPSPEAGRQPKSQPLRRASNNDLQPWARAAELFPPVLDNSPQYSMGTHAGIHMKAPTGAVVMPPRSLKRLVPYGKFVDTNNIVEMTEEWLYDYPRFLDFEPSSDYASLALTLKHAEGEVLSSIEKLQNKELDAKALSELFEFKDEASSTHEPFELGTRELLTLIDVPKGRKRYKSRNNEPDTYNFDLCSYSYIWNVLGQKRTADKAKKRVIYLGPGEPVAAGICYLASAEIEKEHISQFFDRHASAGEYFIDDTIVASNVWVTELHISFYQLVDGERVKPAYPHLSPLNPRPCKTVQAGSYICEASMGFRIMGDFFDRHWTCHIIENFDHVNEEPRLFLGDEEGHWKQRKVLQLFLFERMLSKVHESASKIIKAIESDTSDFSAEAELTRFSELTFEDRNIASLQEALQVLIVLKNKLSSILEIVDLWDNRESNQGQERPRWTQSDEQKYRRTIKRRTYLLERTVRDLRNQHTRIEFLINLITSAQEAIRSSRSLREAENIRLFTYVTIFFLPVSLASSVFGMEAAPSSSVIVQMVVTSAVALVATTAALALILNSHVQMAFNTAWDLFGDLVKQPAGKRKAYVADQQDEKEEDGDDGKSSTVRLRDKLKKLRLRKKSSPDPDPEAGD